MTQIFLSFISICIPIIFLGWGTKDNLRLLSIFYSSINTFTTWLILANKAEVKAQTEICHYVK